jgi:hypothetical protein
VLVMGELQGRQGSGPAAITGTDLWPAALLPARCCLHHLRLRSFLLHGGRMLGQRPRVDGDNASCCSVVVGLRSMRCCPGTPPVLVGGLRLEVRIAMCSAPVYTSSMFSSAGPFQRERRDPGESLVPGQQWMHPWTWLTSLEALLRVSFLS